MKLRNLSLLFLTGSLFQAASALSPGDIAFTGFNVDDTDNFAFVALAPIPMGTVIYFTDEEWNGTGWAGNGECAWTWTATSNIAAGSIVTIDNLNALFTAGTTSNLGTIGAVSDPNNNPGLANSNEALFAFESNGTVDANGVPNVTGNFLAVISNEDAAGAGFSLSGTGLSEAAGTAVIFTSDEDGMAYSGPRAGETSFAGYLLLLADRATNWQTEAGDGTLLLPFDTTPFVEGSLSNTLTLSVSPSSFSESATNPAATGTVTRSVVTASDLEVTLVSADTSEATVPATVTILANQASANFNVTAVDDSIPDGDKTFNLTASAVASTASNFSVTVQDDADVLPPTALQTGDIAFTAINGDRDAIAFVALDAIPAGEVIHFTDSAWDGSPVDSTNHFVPGEGDVTWTSPVGGVAAGTVVVIDAYNTTPVASVGTATGGSGISTTAETIYAYQGLAVREPVTFLAAVSNATIESIAGTGLTLGSTALQVLPSGTDAAEYTGPRTGQAAIANYLALIGDVATYWTGSGEGDFSGTVPNATPFDTNLPASATVEIAATVSTAEGNSGSTPLNFAVTRSVDSTGFSVDYAVTGGTATSGDDFTPLASGTLSFPAFSGPLTQSITVDILGDTAIESNETVVITLSNLVQTTGTTSLGNVTGTGTITNDDTVPVTFPPNNKSTFAVKGSIGERSPGVGLSGAEIPAFDPVSKRAFLSSGSGIEVIDMTNPAAPVYVGNISLVALGLPSDDISSVTVRDGVLAASAISSPKTSAGRVAFIDAATVFPVPPAALLGSATVGAVPDHLTFTPDGKKVLTADEGELVADPSGDTTPGTVSIIDVSGGFASPTVSTAGFASFNASAAALKAAGVRIFAGGTPEFDFEPEYLAVSPDSSKAMVSLQEANAVAILDIATATFTSVVPLGEKDFSTLHADFSDRDGAGGSNLTNPTTGNPVFGLYMPDQIASFQSGGQTYYITANEGDDRDDFLTGGEGARLADLNLDDTAFPNEATLLLDGELGRLTVSNTAGLDGDTDPADGDIDRILAFGGRSFSILDSTGAIVYDSGDMIEMIVASQFPASFPDGRSDNKGPEPEGVTTATIGCCTYAFVGLERSNMVLVFDITNPLSPDFVTGLENAGDVSPEGMVAVSAADSPSGKPLLLVANEVSNTLTAYELSDSTQFALQILHASDLEGGVDAIENAPAFGAVVDALEADAAKRSMGSILLSAGDNYIPGPFFNAAANSSFNPLFNSAYNTLFGVTGYNDLRAEAGRVDITIMNILGFDASAVGNHEFDDTSEGMRLVIEEDFRGTAGPASDRWVGAQFPYLSANLDFSGDSALSALHTSSILPNTAFRSGPDESLAGNTSVKKLAPATTISVDGELIGVVGATTQVLNTISSPSGTVGTAGNVNDMPALAAVLQPVINDLKNGDDNILGNTDDVNKIVLVSHLQQLALEQALAPLLSGVDVIIAGGSDTLLADSTDHLRSGDVAAGTYPVLATNLNSEPVAIVSTDGEYSYVGRLVVCFDENGVLLPASIDEHVSGTYATDETGVLATTGEGTLAAAIAASPKAVEVEKLTDNVTTVIVAKDGDVKGFTDVYIEGRRGLVRTQETTLGNLTADANLVKAQTIDAAVSVSIKNGGGVRASIGAIDGITGDLLPPQPNPAASKPLGAVSQLDIENTLRFNNQLTILTLTADGLKQVIEHGVSAWTTTATPGQFPQVGGMKFSFDPALPAGSRVRSMVILNADGSVKDCIVAGGNLVGDSTRQIKIVTLNFLANPSSGDPAVGGDSYPFPSLAVGGPAAYVNTGIGEQAAFADLLTAEYPDAPNAFDVAETDAPLDLRIQNLSLRSDNALDGAPNTFECWLALNGYASSGFTADSDNDGVEDGVEFFFNQDPNDGSDLGNLPVVTIAGGDKLLTFTVNATVAGVSGTLQCSNDLGVSDAWAGAVEGVDYEVVSSSTSGGETTTTLRLLGAAARKFWRYDLN